MCTYMKVVKNAVYQCMPDTDDKILKCVRRFSIISNVFAVNLPSQVGCETLAPPPNLHTRQLKEIVD